MGVVKELKRVFNSSSLDTVILFITAACNYKCWFCCYADNLNTGGDLKYDELEKVSKSLGTFRSLLLSGGEPFLRKELTDILLMFARNNQLRTISIPSNGWYTDRMKNVISEFCEERSDVGLSIGISLDGMQEVSDRERGMEGGFERSMETLEELGKLREKYSNLRIRVNSVLVHGNCDSIDSLIDYIHDRFPFIDEFTVEIERDISVEKANFGSRQDLTEDYQRLANKAVGLFEGAAHSRPRRKKDNSPILSQIAALGMWRETVRLKIDRINGKLWPFPCSAGKTIVVINSKGHLSPCELRSDSVDLRDFDFDVQAALQSDDFQQSLNDIVAERCDCTHGCFLGESLVHSGSYFLKSVAVSGIKAKMSGTV